MCKWPNCDRPIEARGYCGKHYKRARRAGLIDKNPPARTVRVDGYIYITVDGKQVMEHRYCKEQELGRALLSTEIVHHRDGNRQNNELANLLVMSLTEHSRSHGLQRSALSMELMRRARRPKHETLKKED